MMSSYSPAQNVPTTPSLISERLEHSGYSWWESPNAVVPDTGNRFENPETLANVVPRTPQHRFPRSPWNTPLNEGRSSTFLTPSSTTTPILTPLSRPTPFSRAMSTVATPLLGATPVHSTTPYRSLCCKDLRRRKPYLGEEQIVPFTPKLNEAATPKRPACIPAMPDMRGEGDGRRTSPRVLLSPSNNHRHLDLFSGEDYFD
ncbi:uncharacterized protein LOC110455752 [Mizuhopecten yessoensis]|uniref:Uncharacterized protein n=1 Tax=Mizuhopecten yessoensis TaxID=6573 RepID=A0A210QCJ0_MIZYE|nr:uncharacterized protein LOC110455752 [Mizuhopecten yessoensis]XP_021361777.1 uncharacterized protein LOC110455752 [Mizuhopecten yessoensis]XP_021361778.1 uncharacterized protein LOC110455752 [Mizuhopecten yessoensis]XP_021361779.1 uncharacterized protein LOC110455752 [Mizuhopecten yessoensis]OWF46448.1 hypothetical protein KP79_PYT09713 [Mizuhopecten yessoensis]